MDEKSKWRFLLVPLVDNDFWVVVRIDRFHCKLIVADPREAVILTRHPLVGPLHTALKQAMKRQWLVESVPREWLPRSDEPLYSAPLVCLNLACWAVFTNKTQRDEQIYADVFGYSIDRCFMQKVRHFVSRTIFNYAAHGTEIVADRFA